VFFTDEDLSQQDDKPPATCDGDGPTDDLCVRKDHRTWTADEQSRFSKPVTSIGSASQSSLAAAAGQADHEPPRVVDNRC